MCATLAQPRCGLTPMIPTPRTESLIDTHLELTAPRWIPRNRAPNASTGLASSGNIFCTDLGATSSPEGSSAWRLDVVARPEEGLDTSRTEAAGRAPSRHHHKYWPRCCVDGLSPQACVRCTKSYRELCRSRP